MLNVIYLLLICVLGDLKSQMEKTNFDLQLIGAMRLSSQIFATTPAMLAPGNLVGLKQFKFDMKS